MLTPFANEPILELRRSAIRNELAAALERVDAKLPLRIPIMIGEDAHTGEELISADPGDPDRVVATAAVAGESAVEAAIEAAGRGLVPWRAAGAAKRAGALV